MINHSFQFLIEEHKINFSKKFKNYIINLPVYKNEANNSSFFKETKNKQLLIEVNSYLNLIFEKHSSILEEVWVQKYNLNQFHDLHTHGLGKNFLSFIWYINCSKKSSKTVFFNPGYPYFETHKIEIEPEIGKLIIFDGCIPHHVLPNKDSLRTIISGNLIKKSTTNIKRIN